MKPTIVIVLALLSAIAQTGCPAPQPAVTCTSGQQLACACPTGGTGAQRCRSDGTGFDECIGCSNPDLLPPLTDGAAAFDQEASTADVTSAHGVAHNFVCNQMTLPMTKTNFALDLNGDGKADNQFGNIIGTLASQNLDPQGAVDSSVIGGTAIELISVTTVDASLQDDVTVGVQWRAAATIAHPDFSGRGAFTADGTMPPSQLYGILRLGAFRSNNPITTTNPASLTLKLAIAGNGPPILLPLQGASVSFSTTSSNLMAGQVNGAIRARDIQSVLIPAIAARLSEAIRMDDPAKVCTTNIDCMVTHNCVSARCVLGDSGKQIRQIFDVGDGNGGACVNPDGTKALPSDGVIGVCEVAGNSLISNSLLPDVQMYNARGGYSPSPANALKDSLSVGIGFTAISATY